MFDLPHPASTQDRDPLRENEIRVLVDVIEAVENRLRQLEASDSALVTPRPQAYAIIVYAVIASARATGHYGPGSLVHAPLLDAILTGADATPWDTAVFAALIQCMRTAEYGR
ncbi:hypothetical protein GFY24_34090 [Nocardia sp. SYP-A9097]|uniref:hypothetical protein n=1 Tax=Nocardia sp. SYP-A9097 TaxID=2663237 RepID=UPI00129A595F|nr:hypothetical protein [Nocardia sp. SYP-A9097]MRH92398.1 hypothetical protein [Nocardia sp. SYP-A9097]